jgi:putative intracellular protease/amidase
MRHFHETSKPTAVLCHGPISLLSALPNAPEVVRALVAGDAVGAREKAQGWIYSGYKMTIFSTAEEQQREPLEIGGKVLFYPDFALRTAGGDVSVARAQREEEVKGLASAFPAFNWVSDPRASYAQAYRNGALVISRRRFALTGRHAD